MESRIKELRKAHGLTQEELGKKLNVQKAAISKYETGAVVPNGEVLKRLSTIFNVTTDYLLGRDANYCLLSKEQTMLLGDYEMLDVEGKKLLKSMLGSLKLSHSNENRKSAVVQKIIGGKNNYNVNGNVYNK